MTARCEQNIITMKGRGGSIAVNIDKVNTRSTRVEGMFVGHAADGMFHPRSMSIHKEVTQW